MSPRTHGHFNSSHKALAAVFTADEDTTFVHRIIDSVGMDSLVDTALSSRMPGVFLQTVSRLSLKLTELQHASLLRQATRTAAANVCAFVGFKPVCGALNAARIPFLLLKGAALNLSVYQRQDLRSMADIDFLIHPSSAQEVDRVLLRCGCVAGRALIREDFYPRYCHEKEYYVDRPAGPRLDVHAYPFRPLRYMQTVPLDAFWEHPSTIYLDGVELNCPSNENMLIHLAAHSSIHGNVRLMWLYDVIRFLKSTECELDWAVVREKSNEWSLELAVQRCLRMAAELFDDHRLREMCSQFHRRVGSVRCRARWRDRVILYQAPRDCAHPIAHLAANLLTAPGVRFRLGYLRAVLFPHNAHLAEVYPWRHPGWPLCGLLWRLVRPMARIARTMVKAVFPRRPQVSVENTTAAG